VGDSGHGGEAGSGTQTDDILQVEGNSTREILVDGAEAATKDRSLFEALLHKGFGKVVVVTEGVGGQGDECGKRGREDLVSIVGEHVRSGFVQLCELGKQTKVLEGGPVAVGTV
jgi:hypothetical protein